MNIPQDPSLLEKELERIKELVSLTRRLGVLASLNLTENPAISSWELLQVIRPLDEVAFRIYALLATPKDAST